MSDRPCTCHPDDNPPVPCPQKYALSECKAAPAPDDARDAQRYRYLRKGFWNLTTLQAANGLGLDLREVYVDSPEKLDYVIDAAMKDQP